MGNGIGKLKLCFTGDVGEISKKHNDITVQVSNHLVYDYCLGDSFCHTSEEPPFTEDYTSTITSTKTSYSGAFLSVSDYSLPPNIFPPFSNPGLDFYPSTDRSSAFENSTLLSLDYIDSVLSGLSSRVSGSGSGPIERGFVSGPIGRSLTSLSLADDDEGNGQRAQGKAGEDRVHLAVSEEHGWVFVGIYDGFNGPDAADFLVNNLYSNVFKKLKELLWNDKLETSENSLVHQNQEIDEKLNNLGANGGVGVGHFDVLKALSEALKKTEASYLEMADMMMKENPELALMGSCVLVMLLNGKDVYLMNVGDSRAILAQNPESHPSIGMLDQINEECLNGIYKVESKFTSCQLTMDHSTSVKEEVLRIRNEHPDDVSVIKNDRVKGSLKVTRAFGAGYLKEVKLKLNLTLLASVLIIISVFATAFHLN
ncbi:hypothetical protein HAX54_022753 [Datura stramonium]|uniref:PPM-type phosphatase domain-containing protein n=1 Tax=Datura stramonium TaxID=4076 RepID=A0ABS8S567_DATST|nr:hypothetical protein [Datura stramonium]